jgi:Methyltransferase FkbM domain
VKFIKNLVRLFIGPESWTRLAQAKQEFLWLKKIYHCDEELIPLFKKYLIKENGFYVDLGAHDGRSKSNTYHLEKQQNWFGILVEPVMHLSFRSRELRSNKNSFHCCAVVPEDFLEEVVQIIYCDTMSISPKFSEFNADDWVAGGSKFLKRDEYVHAIYCQAKPLSRILEDSGAPALIDLLSIDIEGSEFAILEKFPFHKFEFVYLLIETKAGSRCDILLRSKGFILLESIGENLFYCNSNYL